MSPQKFNVVPEDIKGVLMVCNNLDERLTAIEESHKEIKSLLTKLDKKVWMVLSSVIVAIGARYGLDLSGITG